MSASSDSAPHTESSAFCPHFGTCGGCSIQDRPYPEQLRLKTGQVLSALSFIKDLPQPQVHALPDIRHYRNKMEFSFGDVYPPVSDGPTVKLGLKPKGRWYEVLNLKECFLLSPETPGLLAGVRAWAEENKVPPYNSHKKQGLLRHLVLRESKNSPERMVVLVANPGAAPKETFLAAVRQAYPATTVLWGTNEKLSDTAVSDRFEVLCGPGHITEVLRFGDRELRFRISPHSFFQTNTKAANLLYARVRDWVAEEKAQTVLDLYCGGGGITLSLADLCRKVVGVECNPSAVEDAKVNAALNGLAHAEFYSGTVELLLPALLELDPDVVVVDPPRAGLPAPVRAALGRSDVPTLIYVSCNPKSLAQDLRALAGAYRVERLEVFDLFPHTDHVETAVLLRQDTSLSVPHFE